MFPNVEDSISKYILQLTLILYNIDYNLYDISITFDIIFNSELICYLS